MIEVNVRQGYIDDGKFFIVVKGKTSPVEAQLKKLGARWGRHHKAWYVGCNCDMEKVQQVINYANK